jgi:hypothetical protein
MQIQIGVNQTMKLYNVYRLCKKYKDFFANMNITQDEVLNATKEKKVRIYTIHNLDELKSVLYKLEKIPALNHCVKECIKTISDVFQNKEDLTMSAEAFNAFNSSKNIVYTKMQSIIELYESMNIENDGNGLDIKLPPCEDLSAYISYLKDINFIFSQCPFLQCDGEILKFASVDVGSNWLRLTIAATSTCLILNHTASVLDKVLALRSHYITIQQQEELLKSMRINNELAEDQITLFNSIRDAAMKQCITQLENEFEELKDPEEIDKAERSLDKLILLLDKGCEIYATLDSPEEIQLLFPEIQSNLELSDDIIKYLEDKEKNKE